MSDQRHQKPTHQYCSIRDFLNYIWINRVPIAELTIVMTLVVGFYIVIRLNSDLPKKWVDWMETFENLTLD